MEGKWSGPKIWRFKKKNGKKEFRISTIRDVGCYISSSEYKSQGQIYDGDGQATGLMYIELHGSFSQSYPLMAQTITELIVLFI